MEVPKWWWSKARRDAWIAAQQLITGKTYKSCRDCFFYRHNFDTNQIACLYYVDATEEFSFDVITGKFSQIVHGTSHHPSNVRLGGNCGVEGRFWKPRSKKQIWTRRLGWAFTAGPIIAFIVWAVAKTLKLL